MVEPTLNMFDTHKSIRALMDVGVKEEHAESIVELVSKSRDYDFSRIATRDQLEVIKGEIGNIKIELNIVKAEVNTIKVEINGIKIEISDIKGEISFLKKEISSLGEEIRSLDRSLRGEIKAMEEKFIHKIEKEISEVQFNILKWIIPFFLTNSLAIVALFFRS